MKHFEITQWVDFVRAVASADEHARMQQHLASGCTACAHTVDLLQRLAQTVVAAESVPEVPAAVLKRAQTIASLRKREKVGLAQVIATLVYDSFRQPLPAGIRTDRIGSRQLLYEAGDICIDLRIDFEKGGRLISLVGQASSREQSERGLVSLPVILMSGSELLAQTVTNEYGEFQFEYEPRLHVSLHLPWQEKWIQILLAEEDEMAA